MCEHANLERNVSEGVSELDLTSLYPRVWSKSLRLTCVNSVFFMSFS